MDDLHYAYELVAELQRAAQRRANAKPSEKSYEVSKLMLTVQSNLWSAVAIHDADCLLNGAEPLLTRRDVDKREEEGRDGSV